MLKSETLGTFVPWEVTFFLQNLQDFEGWPCRFEEILVQKDIYVIARNTCEVVRLTRVTRHQRYWHFDIWHHRYGFFLQVGWMRFLKECLQALLSPPLSLPDPACRPVPRCFLIIPTDREPGTGYTKTFLNDSVAWSCFKNALFFKTKKIIGKQGFKQKTKIERKFWGNFSNSCQNFIYR